MRSTNSLAKPNLLRKSVAVMTMALIGFTACGRNTDAGKAKINSCETQFSSSPFGKAKDASPIESKDGFLAKVQQQVSTLYSRTMAADGEIDLNVHKNYTEIRAKKHQLMLQFSGNTAGENLIADVGQRHLYFHGNQESEFSIALGAVACNDNGTPVPNKVTDALAQYVEMTAALDRIKS